MMTGRELRGIRLALRMGTEPMAEQLGTSRSSLNRLELGEGDVPPAIEQKARALAASLSHPPASPITEVSFSANMDAGSSEVTVKRADLTSTTFVVAANRSIRICGSDVILEPVDLGLGKR